jgi:G protein-coupled receptor GPR1
MANIFDVLNNKPGDAECPTPISKLRLVNSRGQDVGVAEMLRTRDKIRRQLRFLFIYPLVYIGMWVVPFISHVLQYDDKFAVNPPYGLTCVTTIFICSQAAVDCWLFSTREKPWRHIPGTDGGFFSSLRFWENWKGFKRVKVTAGPGRTRDEMAREASAAYRRREQELVERRNTALETARRGERSWWENAGLDGPGMSPLAEEVPNPMDGALNPSPESLEGRIETPSVQFETPVKAGKKTSRVVHIDEGQGASK